MKKIAAIILIGLSLSACGGGGGSSTTVTPITASAVGTYTLTSYTTDMTNIATNFNQVVISGPASNPPFIGTLKIGNTSWNKTIDPGDGKGIVATIGTYHFTPTSNTYGAFLLENISVTAGRVGIYTITSERDIMLEYQPENVTIATGTYSVTNTEKWHKTSDSL